MINTEEVHVFPDLLNREVFSFILFMFFINLILFARMEARIAFYS